MKRLSKLVNTRIGFFALLVFLFWIKTLIAYFTDFKLGAQGLVQYLIVLINHWEPPCYCLVWHFTLSDRAFSIPF